MDPIAFLYLQLINRLNQRDHVTASQQFTIILTTADVAFAIKKWIFTIHILQVWSVKPRKMITPYFCTMSLCGRC